MLTLSIREDHQKILGVLRSFIGKAVVEISRKDSMSVNYVLSEALYHEEGKWIQIRYSNGVGTIIHDFESVALLGEPCQEITIFNPHGVRFSLRLADA